MTELQIIRKYTIIAYIFLKSIILEELVYLTLRENVNIITTIEVARYSK